MYRVRWLLRPFGYLLFLVAVAALTGAARLLGETNDLGFFAGRLARMLWRYPEITRHGVQMAWLVWAVLFAVALTPIDPITSRWDEGAIAALALIALWRRLAGAQRADGWRARDRRRRERWREE